LEEVVQLVRDARVASGRPVGIYAELKGEEYRDYLSVAAMVGYTAP